MFGMAGSPEASSSRIVSWGGGQLRFKQSISRPRVYVTAQPLGSQSAPGVYYRAAVRGEYLIDQIGGVVVLVRSPGHHSVAIVFEQSHNFVQGAEDRRVRKNLV
jgi:hypothetical protein